MLYVIRREDGKFVAQRGRQHSYTNRLQEAQTWPSFDSAQRECCDNEHVTTVEDVMHGRM